LPGSIQKGLIKRECRSKERHGKHSRLAVSRIRSAAVKIFCDLFTRLIYGNPDAIRYAKFYIRSHNAVIRVYDEAGNVIETHEHTGEFKEP
jgi:hypothetical protein